MTSGAVEAVSLKPCPFCGEQPATYAGKYCSSVKCDNGHAIHEYKPTLGEAITAWNTRATPSDQEKGAYLVWSNEHEAWWGKDRCGYTRIIANAGRYDRAEALSIAGTRDGGWYVGKGNPDEIALPEADAIDQYAAITRAQEQAS